MPLLLFRLVIHPAGALRYPVAAKGIGIIFSPFLYNPFVMADRNSGRSEKQEGQGQNPGKSRQGSGQQTGGKRGQKQDKEDKEAYRSTEQKRQRGNHGGNR